MGTKNNKDSSEQLGNFKNADVNKKSSSLILNYTPEETNKTASDVSAETKTSSEKISKKEIVKKKSKTKNTSKATVAAEKNKEELKEQVESLKKIKNFLNMEVSTLIGMGIAIIKKINKKLFGAVEVENTEEQEEVEDVENVQPEVTEPFSFKSLIDLNIIFTDNKKKPLYFSTKKDSMYTQNDEILTIATMNRIIDVLHETADKLKKVPVPSEGAYKDIPITDIFRNITEDEIYKFLYYVKRFPSKYISKNYRFSESFAAWVISGTPDN